MGGATGTATTPASTTSSRKTTTRTGSFNIPTGGSVEPALRRRRVRAADAALRGVRHRPPGRRPALTPRSRPHHRPGPGAGPVRVAASGPAGAALEAFLGEHGISPFPTEFANDIDCRTWQSEIEPSSAAPWSRRPPKAGRRARAGRTSAGTSSSPRSSTTPSGRRAPVNGGARDDRQLHGYAAGEFAPGGLYHGSTTRTATTPTATRSSARPTGSGAVPPGPADPGPQGPVDLRRHLPAQAADGALRRRHLDAPLQRAAHRRAANRGFGLHTISTHEHNGHNPAESDGYTNAFFFPGQFYDYRWPMQLAGYDTINTTADDPRAAFPCAPGETLFVHDDAEHRGSRPATPTAASRSAATGARP
jgi:manganese oxidase